MNKKNNPKSSIVFFGSAEFSLPSLISLYNASFDITAVITQPDKPFGRGKKLSQNKIKQWAVEHEILTLQPEQLNDNNFIQKLSDLNADFFVVVAYGKILQQNILALPKYGGINVHVSLLPKYRGASPVQTAILSGDNKTGVCIMQMDRGMDTGPIFKQEEVEISTTDTTDTLNEKLFSLGATLLARTLPKIMLGEIKPIPQEKNNLSFCKKISKQDGRIDWNEPAKIIERKIRAFQPWPVAWTTLKIDHSLLRIHKAQLSSADTSGKLPGDVFIGPNGYLVVCCGENTALETISVQPQNKTKMSSRDFILGHKEILISGLD